MIPSITTATLRAGLEAACPPDETLRYSIYCKAVPGSYSQTMEGAPSFAGITAHGTLVIIRFFPEEKPQVLYMPLLALKKVRILGALGHYLIRLTFFTGHFTHEYTLTAGAHPHGARLSHQPEQLEGFVQELRKLS